MKRFTSRDLQSPYQRMLGPGPTYQPRGVRRTSANGFGTMQIMHRRQEVKNMTEVREECASADLAQSKCFLPPLWLIFDDESFRLTFCFCSL